MVGAQVLINSFDYGSTNNGLSDLDFACHWHNFESCGSYNANIGSKNESKVGAERASLRSIQNVFLIVWQGLI